MCLSAGDMACISFCWPCRPSSSGRPPPQPTCHQDSEWSDEGCALQGGQPPLLGPLMVSLQVCACIVAAPRMHPCGCHLWAPLRRRMDFALTLFQQRLWFAPAFWGWRIEPFARHIVAACRPDARHLLAGTSRACAPPHHMPWALKPRVLRQWLP